METMITRTDAALVRENLALKQELRRTQAELDQVRAYAAENKRLAKSYRRRNLERYAGQVDRRERRREMMTEIMLALGAGAVLWGICLGVCAVYKLIALG